MTWFLTFLVIPDIFCPPFLGIYLFVLFYYIINFPLKQENKAVSVSVFHAKFLRLKSCGILLMPRITKKISLSESQPIRV